MKAWLGRALQRTLARIVARRDARIAAQAAAPAAAPAPPPTPEQAARDHVDTGNALLVSDQPAEAEKHYRRALELDPSSAAARLNLANVLLATGRFEDAEAAYRVALRLRTDWADAWLGLGCALEETGQMSRAADAYRSALQAQPDHRGATLNLAHVLRSLGDHAAAVALFRGVLDREPDDDGTASNLLFTLNFMPETSAASLLAEHRAWGERLAARVPAAPARTAPDPARRLRVGYLSPDFARHPVAQFVAPLLRHHDAGAVEVFCYADGGRADEITQQLHALVPHWRPVGGLDDAEVAQQITDDAIDVLVDLAGHTANNRLRVFARKPAPVQITWLGYLATTGLPAMEYRLCDRHTDPPGVAEAWQTETPLRLPDSQWCYAPVLEVPVAPPPRAARGHWTFGSFNQLPKLSAPLLEAWADLLLRLPDSRLRIAGVADTGVVDRLLGVFSRRGIAPERLTFAGRTDLQAYLDSFAEVDVALDSFPYTGGTTTCDALYMGVPVATVAGDRTVARSGVSLLTTVGLGDWIAPSLAALPELVARHLAEPDRVARVRAGLRERMRASPLMDAPRFAQAVEARYREAWRRWCAAQA